MRQHAIARAGSSTRGHAERAYRVAPRGPLPAFTVVVATKDRPGLLEGCLSSLAAALARSDEIVVVDSASTPPVPMELCSRYGARLLRCELPGTSHARNTGWRAARSSIVAFVDDDVRVDPGWADGVRACFAGLVPGGAGAPAFLTGRLGPEPGRGPVERPVALMDEPAPGLLHRGMATGFGHGANMAVLRFALDAVGGFDERLGPGARWRAAEDLDLLDRLLAAGFTGRYEPAAHAWHVQWRSQHEILLLEWSYGVGQGARVATLRRRDPGRARRVASMAVLDGGIADLAHCIAQRYERGAARAVLRLTGIAWGAATRTAALQEWMPAALRRRRYETARQPRGSDG
ncbi:MAG: glycosyltransferase [Actinomycetota bacterium]|nr:glycosyltransferase [Actinomycetota bacterium]